LQTRPYQKKEKETHQNPKKQLKDDKLKVTARHIKINAKIAKRLQEQLQEQENQEQENQEQENLSSVYIPYAEKIINEILKLCCLHESQARKLIDLKHLNISADGTKLKVHSNPHGKKVCNCQSQKTSHQETSHQETSHCECKRFYNAKDASWGYDSYRDCYVFGYNLYQINSWSFDNKAELPAYLMMVTAARHDSVSGMYTCHRAIKGMGYHVDNACLDTAHDATDFYIMARDVWDMKPFIPLNSTNEGNVKNLPMLSMTEDGVPICQAGHQQTLLMYYSGYCKDRDRLKWRCPIRAKKNNNLKCDYLDTCSQSAYGRVIYTHPKDNPRLYTPVARGTDKWQDIYDHRTSAERVFKREKNDFKLTDFRTRSKERYLFYALLTAIAVHVDTWYRVDKEKKESP